MAEPLLKSWSVDDFLAWEAQQDERYELIDGRVLAMVGGTNAHALIKGNLYAALRSRLRGRTCQPIVDGPKIVTDQGSYYPDLIVTGDPIVPGHDRIDAPTAIVEVLSRSTAERDRAGKWTGYQDIPSLQHYLLVWQSERRIELITRQAKGWHLETIRPPEPSVELSAIKAKLTLDEIYEDSGT
ncbi:MAG: Uma2 family endonuclease [Geminicoccaceae bacterium]|nr:Uma2 family endonuclease [Geminicoccaceae bacterium]